MCVVYICLVLSFENVIISMNVHNQILGTLFVAETQQKQQKTSTSPELGTKDVKKSRKIQPYAIFLGDVLACPHHGPNHRSICQ